MNFDEDEATVKSSKFIVFVVPNLKGTVTFSLTKGRGTKSFENFWLPFLQNA